MTRGPGDDRTAPPAGVTTRSLTTGELASDPELGFTLRRVAGEQGLGRPLRHSRVQKSGLALAGHYQGVVPTRVQVLGDTELAYLESLPNADRSKAVRGFFSLGLSCVIITRNRPAPKGFAETAEATSTPLFIADARSSRAINAIHATLDSRLAPRTTLHGVLVDVFGVGLLLTGKSGIGKSECALELIQRGHRLVADDVVECEWRPPGVIHGTPARLLRHHIEVRGLGVINVKALFGVTCVRERKRIDLILRLCEWDEKDEYDRLGLEDQFAGILGVPVRELTIPVRPGRDMGTILEIAARLELLRRSGTHPGREFVEKLEGALGTRPRLESETDAAFLGMGHHPSPLEDDTRVESQTESSAWIPAVHGKGDR